MTEIILTQEEELRLQIIADLHDVWTPHDSQLDVGREFFYSNSNTMFLQCGRKWGKTDFANYLLWRHALLNPGSACYYITPEISHGKEIVWSNYRLQNFLGKHAQKYIKGKPNNSELRITLKNGSFIKIFGSENFGAANGLTPNFVVYDEMKHFHPRFHTEMNPNRIAKNSPLVIIGTPPRQGDRNKDEYMTLAEECRNRKDCIWRCVESRANPHYPANLLDIEKEKLFARGEYDVWYREYEGKIVLGGNDAVFPMFDRKMFVKTHREIMTSLRYDLHKLEWFCVADPGSTTCFAVLFGAVNPYTKHIYLLDEIYETDRFKTSSRIIFNYIQQKAQSLYPKGSLYDDWCKIYDEAAAWFSIELMNQFQIYFMPTQKHLNKKEEGLSLIKDIYLNNFVTISDNCVNLIKETENYATDDKGNLPKINDHLLDAYRYLLAAANYNMVEAIEIKQVERNERGFYSIEEDLDRDNEEINWNTNFSKMWED